MDETVKVTVNTPGLYGERACDAGAVIELPSARAAELARAGHVSGAAELLAQPAPAESTAQAAGGDATDPTFEDLGLAGKVAEFLRAGGLHTVADVEACDDLTALDGIGKATAETIRTAVANYRRS